MSPIKNTLMSLWSVAIGSIASVALILSACGESGTTEDVTRVTQSMEVVTDVSLLPPCSATNEGELVWVRNEATPRMCSGGLWYAVAEGSVAATCSTQPLLDGSGVKILCGGDSIGVVLNGKDGNDGEQGLPGEKGDKGVSGSDGADGSGGSAGKDGVNGTDGKDGKDGTPGADGKDGADGVGCSMENVDEFSVRVICGADSTVLYVNDLPDTTSQGEVELDSEKIAISLEQVSGVTQKGPFLSGSKVLVREMEDGRTLTQTGNSFNGKILNDKGEFKINGRMLVSQYVMLEATGYYRNEVTGENSNSELTLFAITDVNDRNTVNVNLLTHLEYERVIYLVTKKKMKVRAAKKQAQQEVFNILHVNATNFANSEDLNIVGSSNADAALLALSILLQGCRSVAELSELLQKIASDMEKDGVWDDTTTRMQLAEWAERAEQGSTFFLVEKNIKSWGVLKNDSVPNFGKFVNRFWSAEYGLDECNSSTKGKIAAATKGPQKGTDTRYECRYDGLISWHWWPVDNSSQDGIYKMDTYGWNDTIDGALKPGSVTGRIYVFDSLYALSNRKGESGWHWASEQEKLWGGCNDSKLGYRAYDGETEYGPPSEPGNYFYRSYYKCQKSDMAYHFWVRVYPWEPEGMEMEAENWPEAEDGYARWGDSLHEAYAQKRYCFVYDTSLGSTNLMHENYRYKKWRYGDDSDCSLGLNACTRGRKGEIYKADDGKLYECSQNYGYRWMEISDRLSVNTYGWDCLDSNDGEIRKGQKIDSYFTCEDGAWRDATTKEERDCVVDGICTAANCTQKKIGRFIERDGVLYVCDEYPRFDRTPVLRWREANCAEIKTGYRCFGDTSVVVWACETLGNFQIDYTCGRHYRNPGWDAVEYPYDYSIENWNTKKTTYYTQNTHPDVLYGEDLVDARDGNVYKTVYIGGRRWMAENLRFMDGSNASLEKQTMGVLYTWTEAMDLPTKWQKDSIGSFISLPRQGICPEDFHIPDTTEWKILEGFSDYRALQMMGFSAEGWTEATDVSGFSAVPGASEFWSANEDGLETSRYASLYDYQRYGQLLLSGGKKSGSVYIRCIENVKE